MALLNLLHYPDPRLRQRARLVESITSGLQQLIDDMFETMYEAPAIGLAASQVDVQKRVITIDVSEKRNRPLCLINPEVTSQDGKQCSEEGCLSVPGFYGSVERASQITFKAMNREGHTFEGQAEGLLAVCIQHEIDHLEGKLFVDYLSDLKRSRIRKKLEKQTREKQTPK
ncbi:peptide deformylase [Gammaproteobacteria bacterium]